MKNGIAIMAKAFMPEFICWKTTTGGRPIKATVATEAMPRQKATGTPISSRTEKTPKRIQSSIAQASWLSPKWTKPSGACCSPVMKRRSFSSANSAINAPPAAIGT